MTDSTPFPPSVSPDPKNVSVHLSESIGDTFVSPSGPNPFQPEIARQQIAAFQMRRHSGPLPDPETLAGYAAIDPSLPGRIMAMAEKGHDAQIEREKEKLQIGLTIGISGRLFALLFSILVLVLAGYVAHLGYAQAAVAMVIAVLGTAIYTIVSGKESYAKVKASRDEDIPAP
ncbi:hypothetical protein [Gluconobacter oxydans]|uniref:hypothetical protein n=1 Tax=Gluconobacter oxydans TaxID=442 RepID=UPI0039E8AC8D